MHTAAERQVLIFRCLMSKLSPSANISSSRLAHPIITPIRAPGSSVTPAELYAECDLPRIHADRGDPAHRLFKHLGPQVTFAFGKGKLLRCVSNP